MTNRKVKLTKLLFKQAFIELLEERQIHQISVRALCEKADLNRSTFYSHYEDITFLVDEIENEIIEKIPLIQYNESGPADSMTQFTKFVRQNNKIITSLLQNGHLVDKLVQKSVNFLIETEGKKTKEEIEIFTNLSHYCISGMFHAYIYWTSSDTPLSEKDISNLLYSLSLEAMKIRTNYKKQED